VPWARPGSDFTLLFEQAAMSLVKEMPVLAVSRQLEMSDKRLWRIEHHYVGRMLEKLDLSKVARAAWMKPRPGAAIATLRYSSTCGASRHR
tara:strand:- start:1083 stop:1355 length:273 start_codon:yes stop_codon:yes gene_type:complete